MAVARRKTGKYVNVSKKKRLVDWSLEEVKELKNLVYDFSNSRYVRMNRIDDDKYLLDLFVGHFLDRWMTLLEKGELFAADMVTIGQLKMMYDACRWVTYGKENSSVSAYEGWEFLEFLDNYIRKSNRFTMEKGVALDYFFSGFTYRSV